MSILNKNKYLMQAFLHEYLFCNIEINSISFMTFGNFPTSRHDYDSDTSGLIRFKVRVLIEFASMGRTNCRRRSCGFFDKHFECSQLYLEEIVKCLLFLVHM